MCLAIQPTHKAKRLFEALQQQLFLHHPSWKPWKPSWKSPLGGLYPQQPGGDSDPAESFSLPCCMIMNALPQFTLNMREIVTILVQSVGSFSLSLPGGGGRRIPVLPLDCPPHAPPLSLAQCRITGIFHTWFDFCVFQNNLAYSHSPTSIFLPQVDRNKSILIYV